MGRKHGVRKAAGDSRVKKQSKFASLTNSDEEEFFEKDLYFSRQDDDEIDEFYAKKDKIMLTGRQKESDSEQEQVYALSSKEFDSESDEETGVLSLERANDLVTRFVKKKELDSDIEETDDLDDLPDAKAWGRRRLNFYNTDFVDKDVGTLSEKDKEVARMEEEEARAIQKRLADEVDEDAFGLENLQVPKWDENDDMKAFREKQQRIEIDLSKLPSKKLVKMVLEESPELQGLLDDCKTKLQELDTEIAPMLKLRQNGCLPRGTSAENYLLLRHNLLIIYTTNICFYLSLKAKRINIRNHPIVKRLVQFKKLISELDRTRTQLLPQIQNILEKAQDGKELKVKNLIGSKKVQELSSDEEQEHFSDKNEEQDEGLHGAVDDNEISFTNLISRNSKLLLSEAEKEIMALYDTALPAVKKMKKDCDEFESVEQAGNTRNERLDEAAIFGDTDSENDEPVFKVGREGLDDQDEQNSVNNMTKDKPNDMDGGAAGDAEGDGDSRRAINYQIAKNKGLTPHRAKYMRNPRVRHRMKFRKANIRRRGQVRAMRDEAQQRYGGETSGINFRVIKSIKLH